MMNDLHFKILHPTSQVKWKIFIGRSHKKGLFPHASLSFTACIVAPIERRYRMTDKKFWTVSEPLKPLGFDLLLNRFHLEQGHCGACRRKWRLTLICVLAARPRQCPTLSNPVLWQSWMAAYSGYTLQMKTLFPGWPIMVHGMHTRRRSGSMLFGMQTTLSKCCCVCWFALVVTHWSQST